MISMLTDASVYTESGCLQDEDGIQEISNDVKINLPGWEPLKGSSKSGNIFNPLLSTICWDDAEWDTMSLSGDEKDVDLLLSDGDIKEEYAGSVSFSDEDDEDSYDTTSEEEEESEDETTDKNLSGRLFHHQDVCNGAFLLQAHREYIVQDSNGRFFLIDGDSLLYEAVQTKTWKHGQQLHLFYIIELYICRLMQHVGRCEIVFFKDMERIWSKDVIMRIFRCALIKHLINNCNLVVHCQWKNIFCEKWRFYLSNERPSFIFIYDCYKTSKEMEILIDVLAYFCLAESLDVVYTSHLHVISRKLYAIYIKTHRGFVELFENKRASFKNAWEDVMQFYSISFTVIPKNNQPITDIENIRDKVFVESVYIYWNNLTATEKKSDVEKNYLYQWAHYFAIISVCTLSERVAIIPVSKGGVSRRVFSNENCLPHKFKKFSECILQCLHNEVLSFSNTTSGHVADLLDLALYIYLFESKTIVSNLCFTKEISDKYLQLISLANSKQVPLKPMMLPIYQKTEVLTYGTNRNKPKRDHISLAVITSRLSEEYAGEVKKTLNIEKDFSKFQEGYAFDETYHWHSGKPLHDDIDRQQKKSLSKIPCVRTYELSQIQKFNNFMMMYAESFDKSIKPVVIVTDTMKHQSRKTKTTHPTNIKEKGEKKMGKTAQSIIEKNKNIMKLKYTENVASKWAFRKVEVEQIKDPKIAVKVVLDFVNTLDHGLAYEEPKFYLLKLQYSIWRRSCREGNKSFPVAAELIHSMHKILQEEIYTVSDKLKNTVAKYFRKIGYKDVAEMIFKDLLDKKVSKKHFIDIPYNVFQMQYMGHLMKRNERSDHDPRVTGFIPDTWQRELLDVVDNNESVLVVAPTSSGKTFCSYYCMEKVLRESNQGIVVYVSPTKALVNQVHASIYARFRKNMPDGQTLVGVFTRDYQIDAMTCQILVTVPQCLEILLLSPKRQNWASRLSYVIFDEVHCIGGEIGGEVWEHLITLIRCPFLALSATIGNPKEFHSWLSTVQSFKYNQECSGAEERINESGMSNPKVNLIMYSERYSDIQTSIYIPKTDTCDNLLETHPCIFLDGHSLRIKGFPNAMNLSPKEAYELWLGGKYTFPEDENAKDSLEAWCPTNYFRNKIFISKKEARKYEVSLRGHLFQLIKDSPSRAHELIGYFRDQLPLNNGDRNSKYVDIPGISEMEFNIYGSFPALIEKLKEADKLPVLVFMCDRHGVEKLAYTLKDYVNDKLDKTRTRMENVLQRTEELEEMFQKNAKTIRDKNANVKVDEPVKSGYNIYNGEQKRFSGSASKKIVPMEEKSYEYLALVNELQKHKSKIQKEMNTCTFVSQRSVYTEYLGSVLEKVPDVEEKELLQLGIGYHHAGCSKTFRRATEILFRSKYVEVVTATGTLALGIHMPCKTVVLVGDDQYVDALSYRQMSGRSGRRGFDNIGNVVFYGAPVQKISTLIKADLSSLDGLYPISCTLILRLLLLVSNSTNEESAYKKAMVVLSQPFFTHQKPSFQKQLQHFFLFATDHLIRQHLVDEKGVPLGLAGLVSHLHYLEPGNMVFVYLLRRGIFHKVCKPSKGREDCHYGHTCKLCRMSPIIGKMFQREGRLLYLCGKCCEGNKQNHGRKEHIGGNFIGVNACLKYTYSEKTLRLLVCILCHIFCKKDIPYKRLKRDIRNPGDLKLKVRPAYGSKVLLDSLPPIFLAGVQSYNKAVETNFSNYLCVVSQAVPKEIYVALPLSRKKWLLTKEYTSDQATSVVIPFAQLSGCTNKDIKRYCLDREEIFRILPAEIFMDFKSIPALNVDVPKNAYALDFFKHHSTKAIEEDNKIKKGEIYNSLKDFTLIIMAIAVALEQLGPEEGDDDHVIWAFKQLSFEYRHRFNVAYPGGGRIKF